MERRFPIEASACAIGSTAILTHLPQRSVDSHRPDAASTAPHFSLFYQASVLANNDTGKQFTTRPELAYHCSEILCLTDDKLRNASWFHESHNTKAHACWQSGVRTSSGRKSVSLLMKFVARISRIMLMLLELQSLRFPNVTF